MSENSSRRRCFRPGLKPVLEILRDSPERVLKVFCKTNSREAGKIRDLCGRANVPLEFVENLDNLYASDSVALSRQGVVAELREWRQPSEAELLSDAVVAPLPLVLALDQIQDVGNLGTLVRTAYALGCAGALLPEHNGAKIGAGASRAAAGALELFPLVKVTNLARSLDKFEEAGFTVCAAAKTSPGKIINAFDYAWSFPTVLVLGSEQKGIRPGVFKRCQLTLSIPFAREFDSLNIAQAGAILMGLCAASYSRRK